MQVQKKDGSLEEFDRSKVSGGVIKAGGTFDQAEAIASQAETWAQGAVVDGVVRASDVRAKVAELLQNANPKAAAAFGTHKRSEQSPS